MKIKKCPNCGKEKPLKDFGYRVSSSGAPIAQSHCITCRSVKRKTSKKTKKKSKKVSK